MKHYLPSALFFVISFFFCSLVDVANAREPAMVKGGENNEYTRVVVSAESLGVYKTIESENAFTVQFDDFQSGFDLGDIFGGSRLKRINAVTAKKNSITISKACECSAYAYSAGDNLLIIDVTNRMNDISGTAPKKRKSKFPDPIYLGDAPELSFKMKGEKTNADMVRDNYEFRYSTQREIRKPSPIKIQTKLPAIRPQKRTEVALEGQAEVINNLQSQLADGLGAASTRGLLIMEDGKSQDEISRPSVSIEDLVNLNQNLGIRDSLSMSSSLEGPGVNIEEGSTTNFDIRCVRSERFDVSSWSDERPFDQQVGELNAQLYDTLGGLEKNAALKLARLYIHFGFGAEAKQITQLDPIITERYPEIALMGDILDDVPVQTAFFAQQSQCETPAIFWAAALGFEEALVNKSKKNKVLLELSALPIHLRRIFAPKMSSYFLTYNSPEYAKSALQTLARSQLPFDDKALFEEGQILLASNKESEALEKFSEISSNSPKSAEALLSKLRLQMASGLKISAEDRGLIESYATEFGDTPLGDALLEMEVLVASHSSQFDLALQKAKQLNTERVKDVLKVIYKGIVNKSDDIFFVEAAYDKVDLAIIADESDLRMAYAKRLFETGFYEKAEEYLSSSQSILPSEEHDLMSARIAIEQGLPQTARVLLDNYSSPEAQKIKAKLLEKQGKYEEAAAVYQNMESDEGENEQSILSADDTLATQKTEESVTKQLNSLVDAKFPEVTATDGMIGQVNEMLQESQRSRDTIGDILNFEQIDDAFPSVQNN